MSILLIDIKSILKITSILVLPNRNIFWKNREFLSLFNTLKLAITILNIWKKDLSIFLALILAFLDTKT